MEDKNVLMKDKDSMETLCSCLAIAAHTYLAVYLCCVCQTANDIQGFTTSEKWEGTTAQKTVGRNLTRSLLMCGVLRKSLTALCHSSQTQLHCNHA